MVSFPPVGAVAATPAPRRPNAAQAPLASSQAPAAAPKAGATAAPGLLDRAQAILSGLGGFARHVVKPEGAWHNPAAAPAPDRGGLKVVTYNVMVKTTNLDAVAQDLRGFAGDVVCLQETSEATARALGRRLGYHVAWHENPFHTYGGNAVLSRHPIQAVENVDLVNPWKDRLSEFWNKLRGGDPRMAPLDSRHLLHVTLKVGDRTVDVLNGHLTLFGADTNARQLDQITALASKLQAQGRTVVAAGDWNTNLALAPATPGAADAKGDLATPTDTVAEFRDRYPGSAVGSMGGAPGRAAAARLHGALADAWDAPTRTVRVLGETMTVEAALAALRAEPAGTPRAAALRQAADGLTNLGGRKRLDDVFVSRDARVVASHIDQTTRASDHQPLWTEIRWK